MTEQTRPNLDEIEARANAATKGPWGFYDGDNYAEVAADMQVTSPGSCNYRERVARLEDEDYWDDQAHDGHDEERAPKQMMANAAFIAAARTDVPALLDEVRRLQAQVGEMEQDSILLSALYAAGVDNWDGYDNAREEADARAELAAAGESGSTR